MLNLNSFFLKCFQLPSRLKGGNKDQYRIIEHDDYMKDILTNSSISEMGLTVCCGSSWL